MSTPSLSTYMQLVKCPKCRKSSLLIRYDMELISIEYNYATQNKKEKLCLSENFATRSYHAKTN